MYHSGTEVDNPLHGCCMSCHEICAETSNGLSTFVPEWYKNYTLTLDDHADNLIMTLTFWVIFWGEVCASTILIRKNAFMGAIEPINTRYATPVDVTSIYQVSYTSRYISINTSAMKQAASWAKVLSLCGTLKSSAFLNKMSNPDQYSPIYLSWNSCV